MKNISQIGNLPQLGVNIKIFKTTTQNNMGLSFHPINETIVFFGGNHLVSMEFPGSLNRW